MAPALGHQIQSPCSLLTPPLKRRRTEDVPLPTADEIGRLYHSLLNSNPITRQIQMQRPCSLQPLVPGRSLSPYRNHNIHHQSQYPYHRYTGSLVPNQPPRTVFPGLINSLMSQGLIFLPKQSPAQVSIAMTEFSSDLLKVRHDSVINALYGHLPRQCTTCGLRFKCKEEHSKHMDWHVTKNRASRNRKQKSSRKWYVTASMWVSAAEAAAYFPAETMEELKINDKDMAVAAAEDQKTCALCGEAFDDFYSDEAEEWMYKGAVYMNGSAAAASGMDRSQLGPIVHAKCRTASP